MGFIKLILFFDVAHCLGPVFINYTCIRVYGLVFCHGMTWDEDIIGVLASCHPPHRYPAKFGLILLYYPYLFGKKLFSK